MPLLNNFSSALEVSVGLNLLYGLFPDIHDYFQRKNKLLGYHLNIFIEQTEEQRLKKLLKSYKSLHQMNQVVFAEKNKKISKIFVALSFCISLFSTILLIVIGFKPDLTISCLLSIIIVAIIFLPMPMFVFWSYVLERKALKYQENELMNIMEVAKPYLINKFVNEYKDFNFFT